MLSEYKDIERFFLYVNYSDGCWEWIGAKHPDGYGEFSLLNKARRAHRVSYEYFVGELGKKCCLHHCDNPSCVNPFHLWSGTQIENVQDREEKGRHNNGRKQRTHCFKGHKYTEENTYYRKNGNRNCITCRREYQRSQK